MASLIDIQAAPSPSFRDALSTENIARLVLQPASPVREAQPLLWAVDSPAIQQAHEVAAHSPDIAIYIVRDAELAGAGASPMRGLSYLYAADILPGYIREFVVNDVETPSWSRAKQSSPIRIESGISLVHYNMVYGHWLLEMFPKLFAIRALIDAGIVSPIVLPMGTPRFVLDFLEILVPELRIQWFDPKVEHMAVEILICPSMYNVHYHYNSALNIALDEFGAHMSAQHRGLRGGNRSGLRLLAARLMGRRAPAPEIGPKRIFISRANIAPSYRSMANQQEIELVARRQGFTIIQPELLTLPQQIRIFRAADIIVGEFGSGMHNTLFSKPGAKVFCLNWISDVQSRITSLRGQRVGYQLPDDGLPRTFSFDGDKTPFRIDPCAFERHLIELCEDAPLDGRAHPA